MLIGVQDRAQTIDMARRLRDTLSVAKVPVEPGDCFTMTASFGIAFARRVGSPDIASLVKHADGLLCRTKWRAVTVSRSRRPCRRCCRRSHDEPVRMFTGWLDAGAVNKAELRWSGKCT